MIIRNSIIQNKKGSLVINDLPEDAKARIATLKDSLKTELSITKLGSIHTDSVMISNMGGQKYAQKKCADMAQTVCDELTWLDNLTQ